MTKARSPRLATHYFRYASANLLVLAAGFISLPITTRLLDAHQFGVMGYWDTWALLLAGLLKLGSGDAMMRFYPHGKSAQEHLRFATNFILLPGLIALAGWLAAMTILGALAWWGQVDGAAAAFLAVGQVILTVWASHILWLSGTRELSGFNATLTVLWRWLTVAATLGMLFFVLPTAVGVFAGRAAVSLLIVAGLVIWLFRHERFDLSTLDWRYAREGMAYGFPLALKEISSVVLGFIDRVMLKMMMGDFAVVGLYSIGYALASYIEQAIGSALGQALTPVANRLYTTEGAAAVKAVKRRVLHILVYVCVGLGAGVVLVGHDFVVLVASADKSGAADIFVIAALCFLAQPIIGTAGMGLLLEKRSRTLLALTTCAAVVNIGLNLLTIPAYGALGAVYATCFCQIGLNVAIWCFCSPTLRCLPQASVLLRALALAAVSVLLLRHLQLFGVESPFWRIVVAGLWVAVTYGLPVLLIDRPLRQTLRNWQGAAAAA